MLILIPTPVSPGYPCWQVRPPARGCLLHGEQPKLCLLNFSHGILFQVGNVDEVVAKGERLTAEAAAN